MHTRCLAILVLVAACGDEGDSLPQPLAIVGTYADDLDFDHAITGDTWITTRAAATEVFHIVGHDNITSTVIAQNAADNGEHPSAWSRFDWTFAADELWFCQSVVDGTAEADVRAAAAAADDHAPIHTGCRGEPWRRLRAPLGIRGRYQDPFGISHEVSQTTWTQTYETDVSVFHITVFDNAAGTLAAQNDAANAAAPELWSRIAWTRDNARLWYCQHPFDATSEAAALAAALPNASDPENGGCAGWSWSRMDETP